jgi:hypothetical protein
MRFAPATRRAIAQPEYQQHRLQGALTLEPYESQGFSLPLDGKRTCFDCGRGSEKHLCRKVGWIPLIERDCVVLARPVGARFPFGGPLPSLLTVASFPRGFRPPSPPASPSGVFSLVRGGGVASFSHHFWLPLHYSRPRAPARFLVFRPSGTGTGKLGIFFLTGNEPRVTPLAKRRWSQLLRPKISAWD